ncbi:MAG: amy13A [Clostridiales bacterium]|jgi:hypothetical protein|nr:amy13A [Clostridiales bacterium]
MRKNLLKKTMTMVMAMVLLVSTFCLSAGAAEGKLTIHVKNTPGWEKVCIYTYGPELAGPWAGKEMTNDGDGWFSITFDAGDVTTPIFNNANGAQTGDLKDTITGPGEYWFVLSADGKEATVSTTNPDAAAPAETPAETPTDESPKTGDFSVLPAALLGLGSLGALVANKRKK